MFLGIALVFFGAWSIIITIVWGVFEYRKTGLVSEGSLGSGFWLGAACIVIGTVITGISYVIR